jgi:hypothetical protein
MRKKLFTLCDKNITRGKETATASTAYCTNPTHLPCQNCGSNERKLGIGKGPHSASLRCGQCDRFIKWIGKSELRKLNQRGGQI